MADGEKTAYEIAEAQGAEAWQLERELSLLEVGDDVAARPLKTLSEGERTKVYIALLFLRSNNFILLDEPTNHLDLHGRQVLAQYLNKKKGFLLVSHDRALLDACTDHTLSINKADITVQAGNFSSWLYNKQLEDNFELAQNAKLKKEVDRLATVARQTATWSDKVEATKIGTHAADRGAIGHKAAKMMKRAKATQMRRERAADEKSALLKNIEQAEPLAIHPLEFHSQRLVELRDISVEYGGKPVLSGVSFTIEKGDRVALFGANGSGKSSIVKLITGADISYSGGLFVAKNLIISHVAQNADMLFGCVADFAERNNIDDTLFKAILRKFDFERASFDSDVSELSDGQKKKIMLAKSLCERAHIYIWDEPMNYVDVISRMQIEDMLLEYKPTMLFIEHDSAFTEKLATKTIQL